ncbi:hypothetical protein GCM10020331_068790 [Ectobacillus funiculus]
MVKKIIDSSFILWYKKNTVEKGESNNEETYCFEYASDRSLFLLAPTASIYAETNQDKLNSIESQLNGTSQQLDNHKQEKLQIEQDIALLQQKLDELNTAIANTEQELATIEQQIKETEAVIKEKNRRIEYLQVQIEKNDRFSSISVCAHCRSSLAAPWSQS